MLDNATIVTMDFLLCEDVAVYLTNEEKARSLLSAELGVN